MADSSAWVPATVEKVIQETPEVRTLRIRRDNGHRFKFKPGQYYTLRLPQDQAAASYSAASGTWEGPTGRITAQLLKNIITDFSSAFYLICGPFSLVKAISFGLYTEGIPKERILCQQPWV